MTILYQKHQLKLVKVNLKNIIIIIIITKEDHRIHAPAQDQEKNKRIVNIN